MFSFKKLTITTQMVINAFLVMIVVIAVFTFAYAKISQIMIDKNKSYSTEITLNIQRNTGLYFQEISSILHNIGYDRNTQKFLAESDAVKSYDLSKELMFLSINMINIKKDILNIVIIGENGNYFAKNGEYDIVKNLMDQIPKDGKIYNTGFEKLDSIDNNGRISIMYGMEIKSAYDESIMGSKIGFAAVLVDVDPIFDEISSFSNNTGIKYYIIDKNGNAYSKNDPLNIINNKELINSIIKKSDEGPVNQETIKINGQKNIVLVNDIPEIEGRIVSFMPEKELFAEITQVRITVLAVLLIAVMLLSVLFFVIINNITLPVKSLISFMNSVKSGNIKNLRKQVELEGYSEIRLLSREFNSMLDEINNLTHRLLDTSSKLYEAEIEKEKSELAFLRSQINPHFLYNTLEVMKGMALDVEQSKLYDMANSLAMVFRYSVKGENIVDLREEFRIVKAYIQIHLLRFNKRFEAVYEIDESTLDLKIPKMILQPVVENAIFHGLEAKRVNGSLFIGSRVTEGRLTIWVKDDGSGIEEDKLSGIQKNLASSPSIFRADSAEQPENGSIGLYNVNNRIRHMYGREYGLSVSSIKNEGTEVIIVLPAVEGKNV